MFLKFKEKISTLNRKCLVTVALFLGLCIILEMGIFFYDTVLLELVLGHEIVVRDLGLTLVSLALSVYGLLFLIKIIFRKEK